MKLQKILLLSLAIVFSLTALTRSTHAQGGKLYQQMSQDERRAFVAEQARRIAREMSGGEYEFTADFEAAIQKFVDKYAKRIGDSAGERDMRLVFERGRTVAPTLISAFKARNVSPIIGLYLPLIESEYINIPSLRPHDAGIARRGEICGRRRALHRGRTEAVQR